jgi:hypothetical protein
MMRRRVIALVLTLAVTGTPEALAMCHVVCAGSTSQNDTTSSHTHSGNAIHHPSASHHPSAPGSDPSITSDAHPCGRHGEQLSPLTAQAPERATTVAIMTTVALLLHPLPLAPIHCDTGHANRSASVPLHTPLRI